MNGCHLFVATNSEITIEEERYSVDLEELEAVSEAAIFPNPVNDVVNVTNNENILVNDVEVVDFNGRIVKTTKFENVSNAQINLSDVAAGVYMMTVSSDKGSVTKKIVKK